MSQQELPYEIRDLTDPEGGLYLELYTEGRRVAAARTRAEALAEMTALLGISRDEVRDVLERALVDELKHQLAKVEIDAPQAVPPGGLRFVSRYVYRDFDAIWSGVVWYDVPSSMTGPGDLPAVVRNKMRFEVHRKLTEHSPNAHGIVELLR